MDKTTIQITKEDEERDEMIEAIIKSHPRFYAELSDLKGKKKEELFKRLGE